VSSRPPEPQGAVLWRRYGDSVWVVVPSLVFGFFTWLSFFILGIRGRRRDWMMTGAAYAVYSALAFFALGRPEVDADDTAGAFLGFAVLVAWIGGSIHVLVANRAFQRVRLASGLPEPDRARRATALAPAPADDVGLGLGNPAAEYLAASQPVATPPPGSPAPEAPVEANTASQRTLSRLPGVTPALARRWVSERRRRGGFRDLDDLAAALDLQPHEIVHLRPRLSFTAQGSGRRRPRLPGRGRVLDV
jgi:DNA uptake protein ComE-like DNA-binding protein